MTWQQSSASRRATHSAAQLLHCFSSVYVCACFTPCFFTQLEEFSCDVDERATGAPCHAAGQRALQLR